MAAAARPDRTRPSWTRPVADVALWSAIGLVMAILGPFGSIERTPVERLIYWQICMVGGGLIGIAVDLGVQRVTRAFWPRLLASSLLMTPPVTVLVGFAYHLLVGLPFTRPVTFPSMFEVSVVCFAAMCLRQLVWDGARPAPAVAPPGPALDPAPDPTEAFRRRLSAKRRAAALIAIQAEDHYLRVYTDAGEELIAARFSDAMAELAQAPGFRTHRSWWVAAEALDDVTWSRGRGQARLKSGLVIPISRANAGPLKAAGWF